MAQKNSRNEILIAGIGGMGVLSAGQLIAEAAVRCYKYVSWLPSYGLQPRGGLSECSITFSDQEIASPLLDQARTVLLFDGSQYKVMEPRVRPSGMMIVDKATLKDEKTREDITVQAVPGIEVAISTFGDTAATNLILVGIYIALTGAIPVPFIIEELKKRYGAKEHVFARNQAAFERGLELGKTMKGE